MSLKKQKKELRKEDEQISSDEWIAEGIAQQKARRIAVAATVSCVILIIFLVAILVVQFVRIGVERSRLSDLDARIQTYKQQIESDERDLDYYLNQGGLYDEAVKNHGWKSPQDNAD